MKDHTLGVGTSRAKDEKGDDSSVVEILMGSRALILEDEPVLRKHLGKLLAREGFEVHGAGSVEHFRHQVASSRFDVVLLDLWLPDGDGIGAWEQARRAQPDALAILMTAHGALDTAVRARASGIAAVLPKPLDLRTLLAWIESVASAA